MLKTTDPYSQITSRKYSLDSAIDTSLRQLSLRILPLATHAALVNQFIQLRQAWAAGRCGNALASALQDICNQLILLIAQLEAEQRSLGLQRLFYYLGPSIATFLACHNLIIDIISAKEYISGSALINMISDRRAISAGDENAYKLYTLLEQAAAKPYLHMLQAWIQTGVIPGDEYGEFCIKGFFLCLTRRAA